MDLTFGALHAVETCIKLWELVDPRLQKLFYELLEHLQGKLEAACSSINRVTNLSSDRSGISVSKLKTTLFKKSVVQAVHDLEDWQRRFDPSWFLITLVANLMVDTHLDTGSSTTDTPTRKLKQLRETINHDPKTRETSVFVDNTILSGDLHPLPWSTTYTACVPNTAENILVDTVTYPLGSDGDVAIAQVRDLVRSLSDSDTAEFGLLHFRGVIKAPNDRYTEFQLVFDIPPTLFDPRTLRELLLLTPPHALNGRFRLATQLVRSLMFVHTSGFVHKNIRPDTMVGFEEAGIPIGPSSLIGFERSRSGAVATFLMGDSSWEKNLYRHPKRQGVYPEDRYVMQHDIYSLGVNLQPGEDLKAVHEGLVSGKSPGLVKRTLVEMATSRLPEFMGQHYTGLALACLTCLDPGDGNLFGNEQDSADEDGIVIGVQYIEKILLQIEEVRV
ncbi:hypothetical protein BJX65DRAFT_314593 [Aspergillus insuetus]